MTNDIVLASVAFFSAVVTFTTAIVGYFKVIKPSKKHGNGSSTLLELARAGERREQRVAELESKVQSVAARLDRIDESIAAASTQIAVSQAILKRVEENLK